MLIDRRNWPEHRPWVVGCGLIAILAAAWWLWSAARQGAWPSGGSLPGIVFGTIAGLICAAEFLLWPRKKLRVWRLGRAQTWMKAHIWTGLLALPLAVMHSGFIYRGWLATALFIFFLIVVASGIWGLALQQWLPRVLFQEVPSETIHSQIEQQIRRMRDEARELVDRVCPTDETRTQTDWTDPGATTTRLVVGAVREAGAVQGVVMEQIDAPQAIAGTEPLRAFFDRRVTPFLKATDIKGSTLVDARRAHAMFDELRLELPKESHPVVDALERLVDQRRQWALQARWHGWLHGWLCIHVPISVIMMILLVAHVFYAIKYL
jgi:hypothetical protein